MKYALRIGLERSYFKNNPLLELEIPRSSTRVDIRLMTMERERTVVNVIHLALSFFLLMSPCCCDADVEHQVKEIQNQTDRIIIFSATSKKMSG